jgi:FkbM family methyltransferase
MSGLLSAEAAVAAATVAAMRRRAKRAVERAGLMPQARRLQRIFGTRSTRRDLRDNDHLKLLLAFALAEDSNCIDVGASVGEFLGEIARLAPEGRHIAYEPLPDHCAELARRFPQVDVRQAALSSGPGEASFRYVRSHPGMSGFRERDYPGKEEIEMLTVRVEDLDSALPDGYVPALIKIDVEGAEKGVIEGAIETIRTHRPIVVLEHGRGAAPHYDTRPSDIHGLLCEDAGLRIFDLDGGGPYGRDELERTFERGTYWNFVAHR